MTISLSGQLIYSDTTAFAAILKEVGDSKPKQCALSLRQLEHIDSSGLRMFFMLHDTCRENGAELRITQATGQVKDMLTHCKFDMLVKIDA